MGTEGCELPAKRRDLLPKVRPEHIWALRNARIADRRARRLHREVRSPVFAGRGLIGGMRAENVLTADREGAIVSMDVEGAVRVSDRDLVAMAPTLLAAARYLVRSESDAADLVQTTLEIAVRNRAQLRDATSLRAWLLAIETREAFRLRRRLSGLVSLDGGGIIEVAAPGGTSDDDLAVRAAVAKLPTRMRAAVVLHHMTGLSVAETAEAMHVSDNTIKTLLRLGLAKLREVLA